MKGSKAIVVVGSINMDFVVAVPRLPAAGETLVGSDLRMFPGGKGANQAVCAARLGERVMLIGRLGRDSTGVELRSALLRAGVNVGGVEVDSKHPTGVALIATDPAGENSIVVSPGSNAHLRPAHLRGRAMRLTAAGIVLAQLEIPLETVTYLAEWLCGRGVPFMLDPAPARPLPQSLLRRVSILTPNETEACILSDENPHRLSLDQARKIADRLLARGPQTVILKLAERGALLVSRGAPAVHLAAPKVHAVDTTAAGDAFNGALGVALVRGSTLREAVRFANVVAAISVTRAGAQPSLPTQAEVERYLRRAR